MFQRGSRRDAAAASAATDAAPDWTLNRCSLEYFVELHVETPAEERSTPSEKATTDTTAGPADARLSYKFQRLREKLREAILSGEFESKLPGERQLAKRFHVNAKTLSKALTDLAAEGLLDRSIGRGTYVKGTAPAAAGMGRWLVLTDPAGAESDLVRRLRDVNPEMIVCADPSQIRPSFLTPFSAVLDLFGAPEATVRSLIVRTLPLVAIGHEPRTFSMHCVMPDIALAGMKIGRDLLLSGHRRLVAVEAPGRSAVTQALRQAAQRYAPDAVIDTCAPGEVATLLGDGAVAFVCESIPAARLAKAAIADNAAVDVALAAIGCKDETTPDCSGYFVGIGKVVEAVQGILAEPPTRPTTIWLTCDWADVGTMPIAEESPAPRSTQIRQPMYATLAS
ncbi:GntR family transcriptional regulator [Humisphaera borealis]|uniref:GntR family transcriptional regulator n=1 Tax=Humisphaera borealis TaxID=2807512 RepID=A0A7M2WQT7_9BACT|nr:GntR family transcriptional regulator [Humisphaera borealis]QOV87868.1 GntR family transcriptional regulator [Humisphaera borealis]